MTQDTTVCRFCLESSNTKKNPLIDPCECRGSVQFVHERCLMKWRRLNPSRNGEYCLICLTPYQLKELMMFEDVPDENKISLLFLRFPILTCFTANYILIFHVSFERKKTFFDLFESYQYGFQIFYFFLFFLEWKVRNSRLYWKHWMNLASLYILFLYLGSNLLLHHGIYVAILPINLFLGLLWQRHLHTLRLMNQA